MPSRSTAPVPVEHIAQSIRVLRGQKVLLDTELAALYGVSTKRFNEQLRRNRELARRFDELEVADRWSQSVPRCCVCASPVSGAHERSLDADPIRH